ncbi:MAG: hypothetical protein JNL90_11265 [Planctomycetes bacterium]|nr:hypothetical protein [Planctomycetota bacterium]
MNPTMNRRRMRAWMLVVVLLVGVSLIVFLTRLIRDPALIESSPSRMKAAAPVEDALASPADSTAVRIPDAPAMPQPDSTDLLLVHVVDDTDNEPIDGAAVEHGESPIAIASSTRLPAITGVDGLARLPGALHDAWLLVERDGFVPELVAVPARIVEGVDAAEVTVRLQPVIQQRVVVRDQADRPIEGAVVRFKRSWGSEAMLLEGPRSGSIQAALAPSAQTTVDGSAMVIVREGVRYLPVVESLGHVQKASERTARACDGSTIELRIHEVAVCAIRYPQALVNGVPVEHDMGIFLSGWSAHGALKELGSDQSGYEYDDRLITRWQTDLEQRPGMGKVDRWSFAAIDDGPLDGGMLEDEIGWKPPVSGGPSQKAMQRFRTFREFSAADVTILGEGYPVEEPGTLVVRFVGITEEVMDRSSWLSSCEVARFGDDMHTVDASALPIERRAARSQDGARELRFKLFPAKYMVTSGRLGSGTSFFDEREVEVVAGREQLLVITPEPGRARLLEVRVVDGLGRERREVSVMVVGKGWIRLFPGRDGQGIAPFLMECGRYRLRAYEPESMKTSDWVECVLEPGDGVQLLTVTTNWEREE